MEERKLTICFLGEAKPEAIHTVKWVKYFSDKGHNIHLFSYSDFGNNRVAEIKLHLLKRKFQIKLWPFNTVINVPFLLSDIKKQMKKIKPDIIHGHCLTSYGTLAVFLGFKPLVLTVWGSDILINPKKNIFIKWITKYTLKKSDLITCDAEHMREAIKEFGIPDEKIKVVYFGIDTKKFRPGKKDNNLIKEWGFKIGDKIVISLRGLEPIYNIETLIQAVPIVLKEFPGAKFIIAGKGSEEEKLKKLAEDLNVSGKVKFIGWVLPKELLKRLNSSDVYVSTSLSDGGIASSTAEAMACGLPVVITDSGENKKWIKDGETGFLVPVKSPEILARKIVELLKNNDLRVKFGQNSRKIIEQRNNYYNEMAKMEEIYKELIRKQ